MAQALIEMSEYEELKKMQKLHVSSSFTLGMLYKFEIEGKAPKLYKCMGIETFQNKTQYILVNAGVEDSFEKLTISLL